MCVFSPVFLRVRPILCISRPKSICFCRINILARESSFEQSYCYLQESMRKR